MFTIDSIPAILTGNSTKRTIYKKGQLFIEKLDGKLIKFEFKNSIFSQPKIKNLPRVFMELIILIVIFLKLNIVMILTNIIYRK